VSIRRGDKKSGLLKSKETEIEVGLQVEPFPEFTGNKESWEEKVLAVTMHFLSLCHNIWTSMVDLLMGVTIDPTCINIGKLECT